MKKLILGLLLGLSILFMGIDTFSQPLPPPEHGTPSNQSAGGGAPIGSGIGLLLAMGAAYGAKKLYNVKKKQKRDI